MRYLAISLLLAFSIAASAADLTGKWEGSYDVLMSDGETMKGKVVFDLTQSGAELSGTAGSDEGKLKIVNGKVAGDRVTFEVPTEGPKMVFDLQLGDDQHLRGNGKGDADGTTIKVKLDLTRS